MRRLKSANAQVLLANGGNVTGLFTNDQAMPELLHAVFELY